MVLAVAAKSLIAVMLLVAGGAKLADPASFAAAVRLFVPLRSPWLAVRAAAVGIAAAELALGAASLTLPSVGWLNPLAFSFTCGFIAVSSVGYVFHRGRSCRCFGALSDRKFDATSVIRSAAIAVVAGLSMLKVPPALLAVTIPGRVLVLLGGVVVTVAAFTAARALAFDRRRGMEV